MKKRKLKKKLRNFKVENQVLYSKSQQQQESIKANRRWLAALIVWCAAITLFAIYYHYKELL